MTTAIAADPIGETKILHEFSGYVLEWGYEYYPGFINKPDTSKPFLFLPGCFDECLASQPDIALTKDLDGVSVFARTSDGTLKLTSDDMGLLAHVTLLDNPLNRSLCFMMATGSIRGWSHRAHQIWGGMRVTKNNGVTLTEHRRANLSQVTLVVKKFPRARSRKTPIFLTGGPNGKGLNRVR